MHNGLLYVESEERVELIQITEFNILGETTVAKRARLFFGLFKTNVLNKCCNYNHSIKNKRMMF